VIGSAQRFSGTTQVFAKKTYVYAADVASPRGHLLHWLMIAHMRSLFVQAARQLAISVEWQQSTKHRETIPDATVEFQGRTYRLEVDNSTEGRSLRGICGKTIDRQTLIVAFRSEQRFKTLSTLGGLATWHGYFHDAEETRFNILTEKCWWDGAEWASLVS
jgi:hypothetical protein